MPCLALLGRRSSNLGAATTAPTPSAVRSLLPSFPPALLPYKPGLRALARHTDKHHIENGWAAFHASRLGMESANHLWAVLRYVKKCILPKAQLGWCEDCTAAKYDITNPAETIMAATHCVRGQGCEWKACCVVLRPRPWPPQCRAARVAAARPAPL